MVFHGGFSKGCRTCLKRRVKCDEGKPICQRCIKSKKECLGYRDDNDLVFKDETAATVRKAHASEFALPPELLTPPSRQASRSRSPSGSPTFDLSLESLAMAEANAVQQFMSNFVEPASSSDAAQGFLPPTARFNLHSEPRSPVRLAIVALALLAESKLRSNHLLRRQARLRYGEAMRKVNQALNDPVESESDEVLMAIVLFAIIGAVIDTPTPLPQWVLHNTAAEHLIRKRGVAMAKNEASLDLLMRVRLQMAITHTVYALGVQDFIDDDDPEALSWSDIPLHIRTKPTNTLTTLIMPVANLRFQAENLLCQPVNSNTLSEVSALIQNCIEVDCDILGWLLNIQPEWRVQTIDHNGKFIQVSENEILQPCPGVHGLHIYRDVWVSNQHHTVRSFRAFTQAVILRCGAWLSNASVRDLPPSQMEANLALLGFDQLRPRNTLLEIIDDSCRTVFFHLGTIPDQEGIQEITGLQSLRPAAVAPFFLIRPMHIANSAQIIPESQERWIKSVTRIIGDKFGVGGATIVSETPMGYAHPLFDAHRSPDLSYPKSSHASPSESIPVASASNSYPWSF